MVTVPTASLPVCLAESHRTRNTHVVARARASVPRTGIDQKDGHSSGVFWRRSRMAETRLMPRVALPAKAVDGPLIIEEYDTTTVVRPGWTARLDGWNNIIMEQSK